MALISDPRIFVVPTFRLEKDGTFVVDSAASRPQPNEIFDCKHMQRASIVPSRTWRNQPEAASIVFGPEEQMVTFVSSTAKEFPIFWQAEIMTAAGRVCEEPVYEELWELRKSTNAAYLAFGEKKRPLPLKMEGRLLELVIYLRFFEADEGAADALLERLQQQVLKEIVSANWEELTSFITADLSGGRVSFSKQLSAEYRAAADAFECLG